VTTLEANRPDPSPEITAQTRASSAGAPDFYTKLQPLHRLHPEERPLFHCDARHWGLQANHAADIFRNRYGDCKDKTTLLISMLQVAGIHAVYIPWTPAAASSTLRSLMLGQPYDLPPSRSRDVQDPRLRAIVKPKDGKRY